MKKEKILLFCFLYTNSFASDTVIELDKTIIQDNSNRNFFIQPKEVKNTCNTVTQEQIQERNYKKC